MAKWTLDDTTISNWGDNYVDMEAPDPATSVLGTTQPVSPVAITSLGDSAEMFARIANNAQYIKNGLEYEIYTINVANNTDLIALNTYLASLSFVGRGVYVVFDSDIVASQSIEVPQTWGGFLVIDGQSKKLTFSSDHGIDIQYCSNISISQLEMENNTTGYASIYCSNLDYLTISNVTFSTTSGTPGTPLFLQNVKKCDIDSCTIGDGHDYDILMINSDVNIKGPAFGTNTDWGVPSSEMFYLRNSHINFENLDYAKLPMGSTAVGITVADTDPDSYITVEEYTNNLGPYHQVTFSDTGLTYVLPDVARYFLIATIGASSINENIVLKLPANASPFTDANGGLSFSNIKGKGSIVIEGNTVPTILSTSQDTKILASVSNAISVYNCQVPFTIRGMKIETNVSGTSAIYSELCNNLITNNNWILSSNGSTRGSAIEVRYTRSEHLEETIGTSAVGVTASYSSHAFVNRSYGTAANIQSYGVLATLGAYLGTYFTSSADQITGTAGTASQSFGGTVKEN